MKGKEFGTPKPDKTKEEKDESVVQQLVKFAKENIKKINCLGYRLINCFWGD